MTIDEAVREAVRTVVREELARAVEEIRAEVRAQRSTTLMKYLTTDEAADRAGVTAETIRDWVRAKRLPRCGPGRSLRIRASDLDELLASPQDDVERAVVLELHRLQQKQK